METHYEVLGISETADVDYIKQRFQQLILVHHPDKNTDSANDQQVYRILKAWEVLRNAEKRRQYDLELKASRSRQQISINAEIDLDDMEYDEENRVYFSPCRCSGFYEITENDLERGVEIVGCDLCSLRVRILYDVVEDDGE
ncbi:uncharacterized protein BYT42DRAFT_552884 [Radiomyces spectabilis]|uniref:uncharacterized protein n=1 Tax=Radiomyces spectabilis TaxID=64574 RepID=UPI0022211C6A|nr:uncharacterized protein BYT42DRAFT_552884 [Radiomyces spectabilis]KAI8393960.1 hypothetical protein BYT42DRAFT_552884 [Radiomyces spectabilis]